MEAGEAVNALPVIHAVFSITYLVVGMLTAGYALMVFRRDALANPPERRFWVTLTKFTILAVLVTILNMFLGLCVVIVANQYIVFASFVSVIYLILLVGFIFAFLFGLDRGVAQRVRVQAARSRTVWGRDYTSGFLLGIDNLLRDEAPARPRRRRGRQRPTS